jgi:SAM-dependent methyltransferase
LKFKDHFSKQSSRYTRFRPGYPRELFERLASLVSRRELAWDCGTGSGQAAGDLAHYFDAVIATDPSDSQLAQARPHPRVTYLVGTAEHCPLAAQSVDLVTVAQALHWFELDRFYDEVRRVARPSSVLAAWTYGLFGVSAEVDAVIEHYYREIVGSYWPPERVLVEERYQTIPFPFEEFSLPPLAIQIEWNLSDVIGFLGTWSSTVGYIAGRGADPVAEISSDLESAWGPADQVRSVRWPLYLRAGRIR